MVSKLLPERSGSCPSFEARTFSNTYCNTSKEEGGRKRVRQH
jgi:hypothetical protein